MRKAYLHPFLVRERSVSPAYPFPLRRRLVHSSARTIALPIPTRFNGLHGTHTASMNFPEPNSCWSPGATGKPDWSKIIVNVEASLEIPTTCSGSIIARTVLRDVISGAASNWAPNIRYGTSDGTTWGGTENPTRVVESDGRNPLGLVEFTKTIPWNGKACTASSDLFVYVRMPSGGKVFTFIEIGFYPRVESGTSGPIDKSLNPAIRLNPCNGLVPIRSSYARGQADQQFRKLKTTERTKVIDKTNELFRQETGVARRLKPDVANDQRLANQWLRIRDSVISANGK